MNYSIFQNQIKRHYNKVLLINVLLIVLVSFYGCRNNDDREYEFTIGGKLINSHEEWIMIYKLFPDGAQIIDSTRLEKNGEFEIKLKSDVQQELLLMQVKNFPWRITLLMRNGEKAFIHSDAFYLNKNYVVKGSEGSLQLRNLAVGLDSMMNLADSVYFTYRKHASDSNSVNIRNIADSMLQQNYIRTYEMVKSFCILNKDNLTGIVGLFSRYGDKLILDFEADFELFEQVAQANKTVDSANVHVIALVESVEKEKTRRTHIAEIEANLDAGKPFPDFELKTPDGQLISPKNFRGNLLIVSFWNSTRRLSWINNEYLKTLNDRQKNKPAILSVGMHQDRLAWVNGIALDNLKWNHVLAEPSTIEMFNLKEYPRIFLVDTSGIILAKDPGIDSLNLLINLHSLR